MAAGEYISMRAQAELFERELTLERIEIRRNPHVETAELDQLYQSRGVAPTAARALAEAVMADAELAVRTHAREELGIDPDELGSPTGAAASSFVAFSVGAVIPLVPWFVTVRRGRHRGLARRRAWWPPSSSASSSPASPSGRRGGSPPASSPSPPCPPRSPTRIGSVVGVNV